MEEQPTSAAPPTPVPKQSPRPKRQHPSSDPVESMPKGQKHSEGYSGRTPQLQEVRGPSLVQNTQTKPWEGI